MKRFTLQSNIKRFIALFLVALTLSTFCVIPASADGGSCGNNLNWTYSYGTLTITGEGDMFHFNEYNKAPWDKYRDELKKVILPEGLTSIGNLAFYRCTELRSISIPNRCERIFRVYRFRTCYSFKEPFKNRKPSILRLLLSLVHRFANKSRIYR